MLSTMLNPMVSALPERGGWDRGGHMLALSSATGFAAC
jgi:hypothetical protein